MEQQYEDSRLDEDARQEVGTWMRSLMRNLTEVQEAASRVMEDVQCFRPPQARDLVRMLVFCELVRPLPAEFVPPRHLENMKIFETLLPIAMDCYWDDRERSLSAGDSCGLSRGS